MKQDGFTLLELLIVVTIVGLVVGIAVPRMADSSQVEVSTAARKIASGLRLARSEAISQNRDVLFVVNVSERNFRIGQGNAVQLPKEIDILLFTAASDLMSEDIGMIRFFPDGSSTGGRIRIRDGAVSNKTIAKEILVDWLAGRVAIAG